jgi:septal ring factor EnvC (AmiA/AmiB activator)
MSVASACHCRDVASRAWVFALGAFALASVGIAQDRAESELETVRGRITALEARVATETEKRDDGIAELRRLELSIGAADAEVAKLAAEIADQQIREVSLLREEDAAGARLTAEQSLLGEQVRMSYMTGRQELFKLLLSQENPADLGRMATYYDYLNAARGRRIEATATEMTQLAKLTAQSREVRRELTRLRDARTAELASLGTRRSERSQFIDRLEAAINDSGGEIAQLRGEEERLTELVSELSTLLEGFPVESEAPFESWRGRLSWPLQAALTEDFGDLREGGPLRWKGVTLSAAAGTQVRAVYHGRVAFADWLPGLGLLMILDHGGEYMSLYGHNEVLLREPGDWVQPGEAIAEVGDTGGQRESALYFEIRHRGEPQNPHDWIQ